MEQKNLEQEIALFRYGVISEFAHLPPGAKGLYRLIGKQAEKTHRIPGSKRTKIAAETIRSWLKKYRKGGFDALLPKRRSDKGKARKLPQAVEDTLLAIKERDPELTVPLVIKKARQANVVPADINLPQSTVYKLLARNGLTRKNTSPTKDHRRFAFQYAGELWMSDVMHGPAVKTDTGKKRKTYLIAFIDDASRVITSAAFAHAENTVAFLPVLKQAVLRRGVPMRLFVDNGAAYRSQHLSLVCAKLGVTLIHARPYHAEAKGKIERWFRTVRLQLLPMLADADLHNLASLNRALWTWVEMEYHRAPHRILQETPLDRWAKVGQRVRHLEPGVDLDELFLFEAKRKVQKDRTVSLNGMLYEVDAALVGETVTLRYDPGDQGEMIKVRHHGRFVQEAKLVDVYANCFVKRDRPSSTVREIAEDADTARPTQSAEPQHTLDFTKITSESNT